MLVLSLVLACSDYSVNAKDDAGPGEETPRVADIEVTPLALDFGTVSAGGRSDVGTFTARNVGDGPLGVDGLLLDLPGFAVVSGNGGLLQPGEETAWTVVFQPDTAGAFSGEGAVASDDPDEARVPVSVSGMAVAGDLVVTPAFHDFGVLEPGATAELEVLAENVGDANVAVTELAWTSSSPGELAFADGATPFTLAPGERRTFRVTYAPVDDVPDEGALTFTSNDRDTPVQVAAVSGNGRLFEGFATGWYIVDDNTSYPTTSNPSYLVDYHGESDGYWYEPSGAHGLVGSADPVGDFAILRDYVITRAGAPTPVTGPLNFRTSSSVPSLTYASYSWVVCDFWIAPGEDPARYEVVTGAVDDGLRVIVNGTVLGDVILGGSGRWNLAGVGVPGRVNTLAVILMDNAAVDKYLYDLAFLKDGAIVTGS